MKIYLAVMLTLILALSVFTIGQAHAADQAVAPATTEATADNSGLNLIGSNGLNWNINGDLALVAGVGECAGIGVDLVSWNNDLVTLRGELLWPINKNATLSEADKRSSNLIGGGAVMVDVVKLLSKTKATWKYGIIQPKLGPFVGVDLNNFNEVIKNGVKQSSARPFRYGLLLQVARF